jgi:hypothetical protein
VLAALQEIVVLLFVDSAERREHLGMNLIHEIALDRKPHSFVDPPVLQSPISPVGLHETSMGLFGSCLQFVGCLSEEALLLHYQIVLHEACYLTVQIPQWLSVILEGLEKVNMLFNLPSRLSSIIVAVPQSRRLVVGVKGSVYHKHLELPQLSVVGELLGEDDNTETGP